MPSPSPQCATGWSSITAVQNDLFGTNSTRRIEGWAGRPASIPLQESVQERAYDPAHRTHSLPISKAVVIPVQFAKPMDTVKVGASPFHRKPPNRELIQHAT